MTSREKLQKAAGLARYFQKQGSSAATTIGSAIENALEMDIEDAGTHFAIILDELDELESAAAYFLARLKKETTP